MIKIELNPGDPVWFCNGTGEWWTGTIDGRYTDRYGMEHYIICVETHIDPVFHIRSKTTVSDDPNKPIGAFRLTETQKKRRQMIQEKEKDIDDIRKGVYDKE